ncbi:hypothetical protein QBC36DRAFT_341004, partial [Triangularia setosa]
YCRNIEEEQPEFRRHLDDGQGREDLLRYPSFIGARIGRIYYDESRWVAEKLVDIQEPRPKEAFLSYVTTVGVMGIVA